jgi:hypothetical protein
MQDDACCALVNLIGCIIGKKKAVETGAMEVVLAAANNHTDCLCVCRNALDFLLGIVAPSKENTKLFISSGGVATVAKVRKQWPDDDDVEESVQMLMGPLIQELTCWAQAK